MLRDAISLPGVAKHILSSYIQSETLYYIENKQLYDGIHMSEVGGQSIVFTRQNTDKFPYVHGYDANSLYLYCLGEGQYCGKPITYTQYSEHGRKSTFLVRETVKTPGATGHTRRCTSKYSERNVKKGERKQRRLRTRKTDKQVTQLCICTLARYVALVCNCFRSSLAIIINFSRSSLAVIDHH